MAGIYIQSFTTTADFNGDVTVAARCKEVTNIRKGVDGDTQLNVSVMFEDGAAGACNVVLVTTLVTNNEENIVGIEVSGAITTNGVEDAVSGLFGADRSAYLPITHATDARVKHYIGTLNINGTGDVVLFYTPSKSSNASQVSTNN